MNKFGKVFLCLLIPALMAGSGCGIYYGIQYHNLDQQIVEDDSGMLNVVDDLRKSITNLESEKESLTVQLSSLQGQYDALNQLRQNLEETNNAVESENTNLKAQLEELNNQKTQLNAQITDLNNQIADLNSQIETLNSNFDNYKETSNEEIVSLKNQVSSLNSQVNSLNATISNLTSDIDDYEVKVISLNTEIANLNNTVSEYEKEIEKYKNTIEELKKINSCVVTFTVDGVLYNTQQVGKTDSPVSIDDPTSDSYIFDGWTVTGSTDIVDPFTFSVTEDIEFVASIRKYKIVTFTVDNEIVSTQRIFSFSELEISAPEKEHYSFLGWSLDGENIIDLSAYSFTSDVNFIAVFEVSDALPFTFEEGVLTGYLGNDTEVVVPTAYSILEEGVYVAGNDIPIVEIGKNAFNGNSIITSVTLNKNVNNIGNSAFKNCSGLISIKLSDNLTSISDYAFYGCECLTSIILPDSLESIGYASFNGCKNLISVSIPNNVESIGAFAFSGCSKISRLVIGSNVKKIYGVLFGLPLL